MNDIALIWDNANGRADFAIAGGDLQMDPGLGTSLIISYFCDRVADRSDKIPDGGTDPRGWWGDTPAPGATVDGAGINLTGSKLWLASKLQVPETLVQMRAFCLQATRWYVADGIARQVVPTVTFPARGWTLISTAIFQSDVPSVYDLAWSAT